MGRGPGAIALERGEVHYSAQRTILVAGMKAGRRVAVLQGWHEVGAREIQVWQVRLAGKLKVTTRKLVPLVEQGGNFFKT